MPVARWPSTEIVVRRARRYWTGRARGVRDTYDVDIQQNGLYGWIWTPVDEHRAEAMRRRSALAKRWRDANGTPT